MDICQYITPLTTSPPDATHTGQARCYEDIELVGEGRNTSLPKRYPTGTLSIALEIAKCSREPYALFRFDERSRDLGDALEKKLDRNTSLEILRNDGTVQEEEAKRSTTSCRSCRG